jgi:diguanylate cyclase (GGDEF)-like protein/putative nucleotidyltransferase with HDIG domain
MSSRPPPVILSHRALSRLCTGGLAVVLLFMAGFAIVEALRIDAASQGTARSTQLADAYERARFAVATEESLERKYRLEPLPEVLSRFERAAADYGTALNDVAKLGATSDRALVGNLVSRQRSYRAAIGHMFDAVDSHEPRRVNDIDVHQVDPQFAVIEVTVDRAAAAHRTVALRQTAALSHEAGAIKLATPIAFLLGMALLGFFAMLLVKRGRRDAARETEVLVLAKAALEDSLTGLSNRRKLAQDLDHGLAQASASAPLALVIFDLDGFKDYNDAFGHPAGDALLARLARRLHTVAGGAGEAYRLGGDEFCLLAPADNQHPERLARLGAGALSEAGEGFAIGCSYGIALLPHEAASSEDALRLADRRLYVSKQSGRTSARSQSSDVLLATMSERDEGLTKHNLSVAALAERLAERLGLAPEQVATIRHAAELHDVGKVAIPDEILSKPGPLTADEWAFMHEHAAIGERILSAAPALTQVATLVGASHERYDGSGYPDGLAGEEIPIGARIIAACDSFAAMTSDRPYRSACSEADAIRELERCSGTQFEPDVVGPLIELLSAPVRAAA